LTQCGLAASRHSASVFELAQLKKVDIDPEIQVGAGRREMADQLEFATLHRIGSAAPLKQERYTFDFVVNGESLFKATQASNSDMCGSLSDPRFERDVARRFNNRIANMLTSDVPVSGGHRVALFVCPECGDLACGAITVLVSRNDLVVQWSDFAYENGYEAETKLTHVGPFEFEWAAYLTVIKRAGAD
jgi:hypothetical protein